MKEVNIIKKGAVKTAPSFCCLQEALNAGADDCLTKPFSVNELADGLPVGCSERSDNKIWDRI